MSLDKWAVKTHHVEAAHMRGFPRGRVDEFSDKPLLLAVKQYTPLSNPAPKKGDVTIVMSAGLGVSKEPFEPFFDALLACSERTGAFRIRNIWCADPWNMAESYRLNQDLVGDDPHWLDHSRDLYHFINTYQRQMPPPIIGMGESWGAGHFSIINGFHPRLFAGIALLEPALGPGMRMGPDDKVPHIKWPSAPKYYPGSMASKRKDRWKTREDAVKHLSKAPFYRDMDEEARRLALQHDLYDASDETGPYVTLATPKAVEAQLWSRPETPLKGLPQYHHHELPDEGYSSGVIPGFYRPEGPLFHQATYFVTCPTLIVFGEKSYISQRPDYREAYMRHIGAARYGGGGVKTGQAESVIVPGAAHAVCLHKPRETAEATAPWIARICTEYMRDYEARRTGRPVERTLSEEWMKRIRDLDHLPRPGPGDLKL